MPNLFLEELFHDSRYFWDVCITVIVSICFHELSHGIVAIWHGDRTPIETGHMTMNPLKHMGMMSLILLLVAGIAWGAMPVNPSRLRGRHARALVALAGPAANVLMAALAILGLGIWLRIQPPELTGRPDDPLDNLRYFLVIFGTFNIALAIFNLIPFPPLDGSRVLADFSSSYTQMMQSMRQGGNIVFLIIFMFAANYIFTLADDIYVPALHFVRSGHF